MSSKSKRPHRGRIKKEGERRKTKEEERAGDGYLDQQGRQLWSRDGADKCCLQEQAF